MARTSAPAVAGTAIPSAPRVMVERPRLRELLLDGLARPATLVCGPAGSGKTAFVAAAARGLPRVAWIALEPGDDPPDRLWDALSPALEAAGAVPAGSALAGLAATPRETLMPRLVNALAALPAPVVVVLDDVGALRSRVALDELAFLLAHMPDTLRLVLTARTDPPLPLHVLRVRNRLLEIRSAELAFTEAEAAQLFAAHDLALPEALVRTLHRRTEGWAAGLRLAALSLQRHEDPERFAAEFGGDDRGVAGYLLAEVLDHEPPRVRAFLLRTSIAERVCGELADALTGDGRGAETLAALERTNGFVRAAGDGWFRYHPLFATLLRARAPRELPGELPRLHALAARWYAQRGAAVEALRHAAASGDWDVAVAAVAGRWVELHARGEAATVRELLDALPPQRAALAAGLACAALDAGDADAAATHLAQAEAAGTLEGETVALARLLRARLEGDLDRALAAAGALGGGPDETRGALVHALVGETALWAHRREQAGEELGKAVTLARLNALDRLAVAALANLALLDVPAGDRGHAREALDL
ncbi:MAG TPA: hypothetical protein VFG79_17580, partial [Solirubrobacter sp.]|nr:hypothetical protein [Solirubrobacter sp.]